MCQAFQILKAMRATAFWIMVSVFRDSHRRGKLKLLKPSNRSEFQASLA